MFGFFQPHDVQYTKVKDIGRIEKGIESLEKRLDKFDDNLQIVVKTYVEEYLKEKEKELRRRFEFNMSTVIALVSVCISCYVAFFKN